jgi:hypothetical protein
MEGIFDLLNCFIYEELSNNTIHNLRLKASKSRYQLWQLTGLDQAFLGRLEKDE